MSGGRHKALSEYASASGPIAVELSGGNVTGCSAPPTRALVAPRPSLVTVPIAMMTWCRGTLQLEFRGYRSLGWHFPNGGSHVFTRRSLKSCEARALSRGSKGIIDEAFDESF